MLLISDKEMQEQIRDAVVDRVKTIDWAKTKLNEFLEDNNITQKTDRRDAVSRSATLLLEVFLAGVKAGKESK